MRNLLVLFFVFLLVFTIPLISALNINSIDIPTEVKSRDIFSINIDLENNEDNTIRNVNIDLKLNDLPFKILSQEGIDKITKNDEETLSLVLQVLPGSASKIYTMPAVITYETDNINQKETSFTIVVNDRPILDLTAKSDPIIKGEKSTITIKIINKGLGDIKFLNVELAPSGFTLLSEKQQYIGELASDDFDSVEFDIALNQNAQRAITSNVLLTYEDIAGKKYSETKPVELRVYDRSEAESLGLIKRNNTPYIITGIIIIVILFLIYRRIRKRKK